LSPGRLAATTLLAAPAFVWPMVLAAPASLARLALTTRAVPRLLSR
jgi:hypothetical protein